MAWWKDFSNILALLGIPTGLVLVFWGPEDGKAFGYTIIGYSLGVGSKAVTDKRKKIIDAKYTPILLFALFLSAMPGCALLSGDVNWNAVNTELKAIQADLGDMVTIVEEDPKLKPMLQKLHDVVGRVQEGLQEYIDSEGIKKGGVVGALNLALSLSNQLLYEIPLDGDVGQRIRIGLLALRVVLRRVEGYLIHSG